MVRDRGGSADTAFGKNAKEREAARDRETLARKIGTGKKQRADAIVKYVVTHAKFDESSVSVAIEEVESSDWAENVYEPDILNKQDKLYRKPGYRM